MATSRNIIAATRRTHQPSETNASLRFARVAFTGRLATLSRTTAHELVRRAGGVPIDAVSRRTTVLVVGMRGWPLLEDGQVTSKLMRAESLRRAGRPVEIISERAFRERVGLAPASSDEPKPYDASEAARLVDVSVNTLRRWEQLSLIRSSQGRFDFRDVVSLQTIHTLLQHGASLAKLGESLTQLRGVLPDIEHPLTQLRLLSADGGALLAELGEALVDADGQFRFDFDHNPQSANPAVLGVPDHTALRMPTDADGVDALIERAEALEDAEQFERAAEAYHAVLKTLSPEEAGEYRAATHFNLGNVLRELGDLESAVTHYQHAVDSAPDLPYAWYNLADVQETLGRLDDAIASLHAALNADPLYVDALYNLAACLEQLGDVAGARTHWRRYLALEPHGEWARVARSRVEAYVS